MLPLDSRKNNAQICTSEGTFRFTIPLALHNIMKWAMQMKPTPFYEKGISPRSRNKKQRGSRVPGFDPNPLLFPLLLTACRPCSRPCDVTRCPLGSNPGLQLMNLVRHPPATSLPALPTPCPNPPTLTPLSSAAPSAHRPPHPAGSLPSHIPPVKVQLETPA